MNKIIVKNTSNPNEGYSDKEVLKNDTIQHQKDVANVLSMIAEHLKQIGSKHDWTKIEYFDDFANDTLERLDTPDFKSREWYKIHTTLERHHINARVPSDVDLFDVLEMIVDCLVAGETRGVDFNPYFLILKSGVLDKAYWNTVWKIKDNIIMSENETSDDFKKND